MYTFIHTCARLRAATADTSAAPASVCTGVKLPAAVCRGVITSKTVSCQLCGLLMPAGLSITVWHQKPGAHGEDAEIEGPSASGVHFPSALGSSPVGGPPAGLICGASIVIQQSGDGFGGPPQQSTVLHAGVAEVHAYKRTELYYYCAPQCVFGGLLGDGHGGFRSAVDGGSEHVPVLFTKCMSAGSRAAAKEQNEEYRYLSPAVQEFFGADGVGIGFRNRCPRACPGSRRTRGRQRVGGGRV